MKALDLAWIVDHSMFWLESRGLLGVNVTLEFEEHYVENNSS